MVPNAKIIPIPSILRHEVTMSDILPNCSWMGIMAKSMTYSIAVMHSDATMKINSEKANGFNA